MSDDWEAECRGLGYMILSIAQRYRGAKELGGDSELLSDAVTRAESYCLGPLAERLGPKRETT